MKTKWNLLLAVAIGGAFMAAAGTADAINLESWDNQINNPGRFKVLNDFGRAAVLDKETQLVWEQSPSTTSTFTWFGALSHCYTLEVGGRKGWRLPTIEELASLVNTSNSSPALPSGHPFTLKSAQEDSFYWSATTNASDSRSGDAWVVLLDNGVVGTAGKTGTGGTGRVWCVRGGQGIDGVQ
jgi:hypothetical protein